MKGKGAIVSALLFMAAVAVYGMENKDTVSAAAVKDGNDTLVVTARLIEIAGKFVPNDLYNYVYIMKYRILTVERGAYKQREILVGHYNPLIARRLLADAMAPFARGTVERFVVGEKHRLTLIAPIEQLWDGAVEDEYLDTELTKYFALRADLIR
jgi:hypothetical protein